MKINNCWCGLCQSHSSANFSPLWVLFWILLLSFLFRLVEGAQLHRNALFCWEGFFFVYCDEATPNINLRIRNKQKKNGTTKRWPGLETVAANCLS